MNNHMRKILRRMAMKLLERARDRGLQSPLVMISLCTSWMILEEAYSSPDADYWKETVRSEMDSIMSKGT
jgi:hypothetical protein